MSIRCSECWTWTEDSNKFCPKCGKELDPSVCDHIVDKEEDPDYYSYQWIGTTHSTKKWAWNYYLISYAIGWIILAFGTLFIFWNLLSFFFFSIAAIVSTYLNYITGRDNLPIVDLWLAYFILVCPFILLGFIVPFLG